MTGVKICGLTRPADVDAALSANADRLGFILAPGSPRTISIAQAAALSRPARGKAAIVAVLVNPDDDTITRLQADLRPDFLQLHGQETPDRVAAIRARFHIPVIKALGISSAMDVAQIALHAGSADEVLLDAKPPKDADRAGGYGVQFDWDLLRDLSLSRPWLLAGGVTPDNVGQAIAVTNAPFVDVSSGVETSPGLKDPVRIQAFMQNVRNGI